jgi:hypothetical protein
MSSAADISGTQTERIFLTVISRSRLATRNLDWQAHPIDFSLRLEMTGRVHVCRAALGVIVQLGRE